MYNRIRRKIDRIDNRLRRVVVVGRSVYATWYEPIGDNSVDQHVPRCPGSPGRLKIRWVETRNLRACHHGTKDNSII